MLLVICSAASIYVQTHTPKPHHVFLIYDEYPIQSPLLSALHCNTSERFPAHAGCHPADVMLHDMRGYRGQWLLWRRRRGGRQWDEGGQGALRGQQRLRHGLSPSQRNLHSVHQQGEEGAERERGKCLMPHGRAVTPSALLL